ncbi:MAG: DNA repair protein RadC [Gemmatimonadetes bacterium]|nr:DNA repair protein RadC [Gemmatimonadota bacterium]
MAPRISDIPAPDRPRERLLRLGPAALASLELLGVVVGSGGNGRSALDIAGSLLTRYGGSLRALARTECRELQALPGIGPARAAQITAALALGQRMATEPARTNQRIEGPADIYARLGPVLRDRRQEEFWVMYLDAQYRIMLERRLTVGILNQGIIHPREVFAPAVAVQCASLVMAHNHPSGDPEPSAQDVAVTSRMVESGRLLGIPVWDHVVLGERGYVSLRARGLCK